MASAEFLTRLKDLVLDMEVIGQHWTAQALREARQILLKRFVLVTGNDAHRYLIPKASMAEWSAWLEIPSDDEDSWEPPEFALPVEGTLSFVDPRT